MNKKLRLLQVSSVIISIICIYYYILQIAQTKNALLGNKVPVMTSQFLLLVAVGFLLKLPNIILEGRNKFTFDWTTFFIYGVPALNLSLFSLFASRYYFFQHLPGFQPPIISLDFYALHAIGSMWLGATLAVSIQKKQES